MPTLSTSLPDLTLIDPDPIRDAPVTLRWFEADYGRETLLLMGNAQHEITTPSLESEIAILQEFIELDQMNRQRTWMMKFRDEIIGVAWIELAENHSVHQPSIHLMIGNKDYRGHGIGTASMLALIKFIKQEISTPVIYSRHLKSNIAIATMTRKIGFIKDGDSYIDDNGLEWQNIKLIEKPSLQLGA